MERKRFTAAAATILFASITFSLVMIGFSFCSTRFLIKEVSYPPVKATTRRPRGKGSICGDCAFWERDFFLDIFHDYADRCVEFCEPDSVMFAMSYSNGYRGSDLRRELARQRKHNNETVILPSILFVLSDEHCSSSQNEWRLYQGFDLVFKHYACMDRHRERQAQLTQTKQFMVTMLGYQTGYLGQQEMALDALQKQERLAHEPRKLAWAFVGNMKTNRMEMVQVFQNVTPNVNTTANHTTMRALYENANFVLSGRGEDSLDCFRHYEASLAGAIPVVVGPSSEINSTFLSFNRHELPPWIFSDSWSSAKVLVQNLLSDEAALIRLRLENIKWMQMQFVEMKRTVDVFFSKQAAMN